MFYLYFLMCWWSALCQFCSLQVILDCLFRILMGIDTSKARFVYVGGVVVVGPFFMINVSLRMPGMLGMHCWVSLSGILCLISDGMLLLFCGCLLIVILAFLCWKIYYVLLSTLESIKYPNSKPFLPFPEH